MRIGLCFTFVLVLSLNLPNAWLRPASADAGPATGPFAAPTPVNSTSPSLVGTPTGTPLAPGTVHSTFAPTTARVGGPGVEPSLNRSSAGYTYATTFGNYSFSALSPYVMNYSGPDGSSFVQWSAFLLGASTGGLAIPMLPTNVTVAEADDYSFAVSYVPVYGGTAQGKVLIRSSFSASEPPTFVVNFTQAKSSNVIFNILWAMVPTLPYLKQGNGAVVNLNSVATDSWAPGANDTVTLGAVANPSQWATALLVDWSDAGAGDLYVGPVGALGAFVGDGLFVMFPVDQRSIDPSVVASNVGAQATAFTSERKTFSQDGFYWAFWDNSGIHVASSPDGNAWTTQSDPGTGTINQGFDVAQRGSQVAIAWINNARTALYVEEGTLAKNVIGWSPPVTVTTISATYAAPISVEIATDGTVWVAGAWGSATGGYYRWVYQSYNPTSAVFMQSLKQPTSPTGTDANEIERLITGPNDEMFLL